MKRIVLLCLLLCQTVMGLQAQQNSSDTLRVSIFGDSYSTFEGWLTPDSMETWYFINSNDPARTDVARVEQTWWWQVIDTMGWKLELNNSWSGSTVCNTGYQHTDATYKSFLTRMGSLGSPDVILVFGGTNDAWAGVPVGEYKYEDWTTAELFTFRPAMACLLDGLKTRYPSARILFISNCDLRPSITLSIAEICSHYDIQLVQLKDIAKQMGHPNVAGMTEIARQVVEALRN